MDLVYSDRGYEGSIQRLQYEAGLKQAQADEKAWQGVIKGLQRLIADTEFGKYGRSAIERYLRGNDNDNVK